MAIINRVHDFMKEDWKKFDIKFNRRGNTTTVETVYTAYDRSFLVAAYVEDDAPNVVNLMAGCGINPFFREVETDRYVNIVATLRQSEIFKEWELSKKAIVVSKTFKTEDTDMYAAVVTEILGKMSMEVANIMPSVKELEDKLAVKYKRDNSGEAIWH